MAKWQANGILVLMALIWSASFIMMKNTLQYASPLAFVTLRFAVAAFLLAAVFYKKLRLMLNKRVIIYCFILGTFNTGAILLQRVGIKYTSASNSAFITAFSVLLVPIFSAAVLRKKPCLSSIAGVLIAFAGLLFITGGLDTALNIGDFYTFLCAVCISVHMILVVKFVKKADSLLLCIGQPIAGAFFLFTMCLLFDPASLPAVTFSKELVISLLYIGGLCTALNNSAQIVVQKYVNPTSVALILLLEPVFTLILALIFRGPDGSTEVLTLFKALGAFLIIAGAVVSEIDLFGMLKRKKEVCLGQELK
ncbi:MAG: DMT family transporter [Bacillota bacterium]|nr:DMT family transporter [Bacillota bacterium]